jgi:hypothetical protein
MHDPSPSARRIGLALFLLAVALLLFAVVPTIDEHWDSGFRGWLESKYTDVAVVNTLTYGVDVTLGLPSFVIPNDGDPILLVNWHHPPSYWLYIAGFAWLFEPEPWAMRTGHLLLFLPGVLALFLLVRRAAGPIAGGAASLLFASNPLIAYYGAMVMQDGVVVAFGIWTLWAFHRHQQERSRRSWWRTALLFFVITTIDIQGYYWGLAMFTLALLQSEPRRGVLSVFSFIPVSVLAFTLTTLHYGLALGGPLEYLRAMIGLAAKEVPPQSGHDLWQMMVATWHDLFVEHGCAGLYLLALLGFVLALPWCFGRRLAGVAPLMALGCAMVLPGVLNYTLFFHHALMHVFWSMHGFAGLTAFASVVPLVGLRLWLAGRVWPRTAGVVLLLATGTVVVAGALRTHELIERFPPDRSQTTLALRKVSYLFDGCAIALTSGKMSSQTLFGATSVYGSVTTVPYFEGMMQLGRSQNYRGDYAFVLLPGQGTDALRDRLDALGEGVQVDDIVIYRMRL